MKIEFLTKPNCEPSQVMHRRMFEVLSENEFATIDVLRLPADDVRRGYDTPTLLVDGVDVFGSVPRSDLSIPPS